MIILAKFETTLTMYVAVHEILLLQTYMYLIKEIGMLCYE